ncbi:cation-transporting P-type ATPase [Streptomyces sp. NPDC060031]|uniref:cation-transporting P-type ATPase n=1 Tax=Streptomyces sp. NPDC060031 TaxID=3347043 RepID=UPI0036B65003
MTSRAIDTPVGSPAPAGLTQAEAARRPARYGRNEVAPPRPMPPPPSGAGAAACSADHGAVRCRTPDPRDR